MGSIDPCRAAITALSSGGWPSIVMSRTISASLGAATIKLLLIAGVNLIPVCVSKTSQNDGVPASICLKIAARRNSLECHKYRDDEQVVEILKVKKTLPAPSRIRQMHQPRTLQSNLVRLFEEIVRLIGSE